MDLDPAVIEQIIEAVIVDIENGDETELAWKVAHRDAWAAVHRWMAAKTDEIRDLAAATATLLWVAADVLWIRHLIDWCDENVVPGLSAFGVQAYFVDRWKILDRSIEADIEAASLILRAWARVAGTTLPVRT